MIEVIQLNNPEELSQDNDDHCEEQKEEIVKLEADLKGDTQQDIQEEKEAKEINEEGSRNGSIKKKKKSQEKKDGSEGRHSRHGSRKDAKNSNNSVGVESLLQALAKAGQRGEIVNSEGKPISRNGSRKDPKIKVQ